MKLLTVLVTIMLLAGCVTTPVVREFPAIPPSLQTTCPELIIITEANPQFSQVLTVVTENYALYNECRALSQAWQQWYSEQRTIFEGVK